MNAHSETRNLPALVVGGGVNAIVPQSIEEMWRVSKMVVLGGLAPKALIGKKGGDEAISAVAIAVMAGAELGLPPMVALRSFTVISGRPALFGDGIINVVRRSRKAVYIRTGYDAPNGIGWCEAKRADTGEEKRVEFSIEEAKRAGLWDERPTVKKQDWNTKEWTDVPNEAPWFRYPQRMQMWRAAGYCLRELFADVLGGITDEYEAREIAGEEEPQIIAPVKVPSAPPVETINVITETGEPVDAVQEVEAPDYGDYFERMQEAMNGASDDASIEEVWNDFDPEATFQDDADSLQLATIIKNRRLTAINPKAG